MILDQANQCFFYTKPAGVFWSLGRADEADHRLSASCCHIDGGVTVVMEEGSGRHIGYSSEEDRIMYLLPLPEGGDSRLLCRFNRYVQIMIQY